MKRIRTVRWITIAVVVLGLTIWTVWGNTAVQCNTITVTADDAFSGLRIAQVSDLHNASFGEGNEKLLEILADTQPDLIAITGDLVDSRRTNSDIALSFAEKAVQFAPCYFVTGNHEARIDAFSELEADLIAAGVTVLRDQSTEFEYNGKEYRSLAWMILLLMGRTAGIRQMRRQWGIKSEHWPAKIRILNCCFPIGRNYLTLIVLPEWIWCSAAMRMAGSSAFR